jgi:hypothetical protein
LHLFHEDEKVHRSVRIQSIEILIHFSFSVVPSNIIFLPFAVITTESVVTRSPCVLLASDMDTVAAESVMHTTVLPLVKLHQ